MNDESQTRPVELPIIATVCLTPDGYASGHMLDLQVQVMPTTTFCIGDRLVRYEDAIAYAERYAAAETKRADALAVRVKELEEKGKALVARWETPLWKDAPATAGYIYALRDAILSGDAKGDCDA